MKGRRNLNEEVEGIVQVFFATKIHPCCPALARPFSKDAIRDGGRTVTFI